ncbi:cytochrome c-551 [Lentibacillus halophilus]|uniref:Cytochrome c-551 n=1 Tax=Lentibacillus halophilus TaxID=295065 RepID=A0ABN0ZGN8_9BACI
MKKALLSVLFGMALVLGACGGGDDGGTDDGGNGDNGTGTEESTGENGGTTTAGAEEIFQNNCASCHGSDLSGQVGPDLTSVGSKYSADEIADIIKNGKGQMQAQDVSKENRETVASWLAEKK